MYVEFYGYHLISSAMHLYLMSLMNCSITFYVFILGKVNMCFFTLFILKEVRK